MWDIWNRDFISVVFRSYFRILTPIVEHERIWDMNVNYGFTYIKINKLTYNLDRCLNVHRTNSGQKDMLGTLQEMHNFGMHQIHYGNHSATNKFGWQLIHVSWANQLKILKILLMPDWKSKNIFIYIILLSVSFFDKNIANFCVFQREKNIDFKNRILKKPNYNCI